MKKQSLEVEWHEYPATQPAFSGTYFVTFRTQSGIVKCDLGKYLSSGRFFQEVCGQQVTAWAYIQLPKPFKEVGDGHQ